MHRFMHTSLSSASSFLHFRHCRSLIEYGETDLDEIFYFLLSFYTDLLKELLVEYSIESS